eukprot:scaffold668_cov385-Prasinococcus_capsulatus_cf.AAC.19
MSAFLMLQECLIVYNDGECPYSKAELHMAAMELAGYRYLRETEPNCFSVTNRGRCSSFRNSLETNIEEGPNNKFRTWPRGDFKAVKYSSCALVGNSPEIKLNENGVYIDQHDAVWRFNLVWEPKYTPWTGTKTDVRMFNRLRSGQASRSRIQMSGPKEEWLFWHYGSADNLRAIKNSERGGALRTPLWDLNSPPVVDAARFKSKVNIRMVSPVMIAWMLKVYFLLRLDLALIGFGNFGCPDTLSSGMHAILIASKACDHVNLFGFSYMPQQLKKRNGHLGQKKTFYAGHSWEFDFLVIRLLHLTGNAMNRAHGRAQALRNLVDRGLGLPEHVGKLVELLANADLRECADTTNVKFPRETAAAHSLHALYGRSRSPCSEGDSCKHGAGSHTHGGHEVYIPLQTALSYNREAHPDDSAIKDKSV